MEHKKLNKNHNYYNINNAFGNIRVLLMVDIIRFDKMTVAQLKEEQKKRGILDSTIKGQGKNGAILKMDRVVALDKYEASSKKVVKNNGKENQKSGLSSTNKKRSGRRNSGGSGIERPKKTKSKVVYVLAIWTQHSMEARGKHCHPDVSFAATTIKKLKHKFQNYLESFKYKKGAVSTELIKSTVKNLESHTPQLESAYGSTFVKAEL